MHDDDAPAPIDPGALFLTCVPTEADPADIGGGRSARAWMDKTRESFANRCTPLAMANASGWEMTLPFGVEATWLGGDETASIQIGSDAPRELLSRRVQSHFGHGVLTFRTGWLFRTPPGWAIWARGAPNSYKDKIAPLEGVVEADWTPFSFTMNWRFTRPGTIRFEPGEAFCFITLTPHAWLDAVEPRVKALDEDPAFAASYDAWRASREDFGERLKAREAAALGEKWQRDYFRGPSASGGAPEAFHTVKRRLKPPRAE